MSLFRRTNLSFCYFNCIYLMRSYIKYQININIYYILFYFGTKYTFDYYNYNRIVFDMLKNKKKYLARNM